MARLIDADALKGDFMFLRKMWSETEIGAVIDNAHTVDAVEVVRGQWIRYEDIQESSVKYICSNCGDYHAFRNAGGSPFLTSESTFNENFVYCRKCGQKNGGREDYVCGID